MMNMEQRQDNGQYKRLMEAALFVSGRAMEIDELAKIVGLGSIGHARKIMEELASDYQDRESSLIISKIGEKYALGIRNEYADKVNSLAGAPEIPKGQLRVLAYISKNEPVMQSSIVKAFGSSTYEYMKKLLEMEFIKTVRVGRTKRVETTSKFREYFSL